MEEKGIDYLRKNHVEVWVDQLHRHPLVAVMAVRSTHPSAMIEPDNREQQERQRAAGSGRSRGGLRFTSNRSVTTPQLCHHRWSMPKLSPSPPGASIDAGEEGFHRRPNTIANQTEASLDPPTNQVTFTLKASTI
jgi:hypothetical protein